MYTGALKGNIPAKIMDTGSRRWRFLLPEKAFIGYEKTHLTKETKQVSAEQLDVKAIEEKVVGIISEQMGVDKSEITRETSFINDLNADSLDTVELVMEFEDEFDMSIPDEEAEKIQTVGAAVDYIISTAHAGSSE